MAGWLWSYQVCTEFGWLQPYFGYNEDQAPAWKYMTLLPSDNMTDAARMCTRYNESFSLDSVQLAVEKTNQMYGGRTLQVENVTFVNGGTSPFFSGAALCVSSVMSDCLNRFPAGLDPWQMFGILPEPEQYYDFCPDGGYTGNSTMCVQNNALNSKDDVLFVPLGSHCLWMSALTRASSILNPQLSAQLASVNSKVYQNLRSYLGVSD